MQPWETERRIERPEEEQRGISSGISSTSPAVASVSRPRAGAHRVHVEDAQPAAEGPRSDRDVARRSPEPSEAAVGGHAVCQDRPAHGSRLPPFVAFESSRQRDVEPVDAVPVGRPVGCDRRPSELALYKNLGSFEEVAVLGVGILRAGIAEHRAYHCDIGGWFRFDFEVQE